MSELDLSPSDSRLKYTVYCFVDGVSVYAFKAVSVLCRNRGTYLQPSCPALPHSPLTTITTMPQNLDYDHNTVTVSTASHIYLKPSSLSAVHPSLAYHGQVGELQDVQLFAVPKGDWVEVGEYILAVLKAKQGVLGEHVQVPKQRVKRGGDEL